MTVPRFKPSTMGINEAGLTVGGVSVLDLCKTYGTPLYVMDVETVRRQCRAYTQTLKTHYPNAMPVYAAKANATVGLLQCVRSEGMGVDVVSGGELMTAIRAGYDGRHIVFHGNNKSLEELGMGLDHSVLFVVDNDDELTQLSGLAASRSASARVLIRIKPEIEAHTHDFIKTGQIESKFGFDQARLIQIVQRCQSLSGIQFLGIHSHIGSQIFDVMPYQELVKIMVGHVASLRSQLDVTCEIVNLGGGIGIQYVEQDDPPSVASYLSSVVTLFKSECEARQIPLPMLIVEPGRSIVATSGITLYSIGAIKEIPSVKTYVFIDGGMADNIRPQLYQAQYQYDIASKPQAPREFRVDIAGKFCESGDVLAKGVTLPQVEVGDILVVYGTGAYNYSMASNYNRFCRPAVVAVENGHVTTWVRRETIEDVLRYDVG